MILLTMHGTQNGRKYRYTGRKLVELCKRIFFRIFFVCETVDHKPSLPPRFRNLSCTLEIDRNDLELFEGLNNDT